MLVPVRNPTLSMKERVYKLFPYICLLSYSSNIQSEANIKAANPQSVCICWLFVQCMPLD